MRKKEKRMLGTLTGGCCMLGILILVYAITGMSHRLPVDITAASIPHLLCLNPVISEGKFEDQAFSKDWTLIQAHVHQRHLDRWLYEHSLINNVCWQNQLNSTSPRMAAQCKYNLSSVWEHFTPAPDPYASPDFGDCSAKQLTKQGIEHAKKLGTILRKQYVELHGIVDPTCPTGSVGLECDNAQKNQQTTQNEYLGGRLPSPAEFPSKGVLDTGVAERGRPFWLSSEVCNNARLHEMIKESMDYMMKSTYWNVDARATADIVAQSTSHADPGIPDRAVMLDNIEDCLVCHYCHNLTDYPTIFSESEGLFRETDVLETKSRAYPFDYFSSDEKKFNEFSSYYYGYYFRVLHDRMEKKISASEDAKPLYIQVTSDSILTPQLKMLGAGSYAEQRPVWGSTLIYELYRHNANANQYAIRILFNGHTLSVCGGKGYCTWPEWTDKLTKMFPPRDQCLAFYNNYE